MKVGDVVDIVYCGGPLDGFRESGKLEGLYINRSIATRRGIYFEAYDWCAADVQADRQPVRALHPSMSRLMSSRGEPL